MDLPELLPEEREAALQGIQTISTWFGQRQPLLQAILKLAGPPRRLRLLELGAGNGHMARWISSELSARGYQAEVLATDLLAHGDVQALDALDPALPEADLYYSSLLLHHLPDADLSAMLRLQASKASLGFVHFDLQRSWLHFHLAKLRIALAGLHRVNQIDALLSIQQGYSRAELAALAQGLGAELRWSLPFRWLMTWRR
jgi:hypothetical protein